MSLEYRIETLEPAVEINAEFFGLDRDHTKRAPSIQKKRKTTSYNFPEVWTQQHMQKKKILSVVQVLCSAHHPLKTEVPIPVSSDC